MKSLLAPSESRLFVSLSSALRVNGLVRQILYHLFVDSFLDNIT